MGIVALACCSALLLWPIAVYSDRDLVQVNLDSETKQACAGWETSALQAIAERMGGSEVGRDLYARTANTWLSEARRSCAAGSRHRARIYYERVINAGKEPR